MSRLYLWGKPILAHNSHSSPLHSQVLSNPHPLLSLAAGNAHVLAISDSALYALGDNSEGQLGLFSVKNTGLKLMRVNISFKIVQISCGFQFSLILDEQGKVYSSGRGENGELGRRKIRYSTSFEAVLEGVSQISAGKDHALAIKGTKVFGWGNCKEGQLGLASLKHYLTPHQLNLYPCTTIFAGTKYSLFVTTRGIFATGLNNEFQLGLGHDDSVRLPKRLAIEDEIIKLSGGGYCVAATREQEWYLWGVGTLGIFKYPTKMSFLSNAQEVIVAREFGLVVRSGKVAVWGKNDWGQLGTSQSFSEYVQDSEQFTQLNIDQFVCGDSFTVGFSNDYSRQTIAEGLYKQRTDLIVQKDSKKRGCCNQTIRDCNSRSVQEYGGCKEMNGVVLQRRLYSSRQHSENSSQQTSRGFGQTSQELKREKTEPKRFVHLVNPIRTLPLTRLEQLQLQNNRLKSQLSIARAPKNQHKHQYMKNINTLSNTNIHSKMNKLSHIFQNKESLTQCRSYCLSPRQEVSFRPQQQELEQMVRLEGQMRDLRQLLTDIATHP